MSVCRTRPRLGVPLVGSHSGFCRVSVRASMSTAGCQLELRPCAVLEVRQEPQLGGRCCSEGKYTSVLSLTSRLRQRGQVMEEARLRLEPGEDSFHRLRPSLSALLQPALHTVEERVLVVLRGRSAVLCSWFMSSSSASTSMIWRTAAGGIWSRRRRKVSCSWPRCVWQASQWAWFPGRPPGPVHPAPVDLACPLVRVCSGRPSHPQQIARLHRCSLAICWG